MIILDLFVVYYIILSLFFIAKSIQFWTFLGQITPYYRVLSRFFAWNLNNFCLKLKDLVWNLDYFVQNLKYFQAAYYRVVFQFFRPIIHVIQIYLFFFRQKVESLMDWNGMERKRVSLLNGFLTLFYLPIDLAML